MASEWASRRESLVVTSGATLIGFPTTEERERHLQVYEGQPQGERFIVAQLQSNQKPHDLKNVLQIDHRGPLRRTLLLDENGAISNLGPLDTVQTTRLSRFTLPDDQGRLMNHVSFMHALAQGIKTDVIIRWAHRSPC